MLFRTSFTRQSSVARAPRIYMRGRRKHERYLRFRRLSVSGLVFLYPRYLESDIASHPNVRCAVRNRSRAFEHQWEIVFLTHQLGSRSVHLSAFALSSCWHHPL